MSRDGVPGPSASADVVPTSQLSRRRFLGTLGTAAVAAGLEACNKAPQEQIIPYVDRPPEVIPGRTQYYATSTSRQGYGMGLLVASHTGRPTKIEGHPHHPASFGKTLIQEQAEVLTLYDPDRAKASWGGSSTIPFSAFVEAFAGGAAARTSKPERRGRELLMLRPTASPLVNWLLERLTTVRPELEVYFDPSLAPRSRWLASERILGQALDPHYQFDKADVVLALDANFLAAMPMSVRWAHDFAKAKHIETPDGKLNRLYTVESAVSVTGATADHRLAVPASKVDRIAVALLHVVASDGPAALPTGLLPRSRTVWDALNAHERSWVRALGKDLASHRGRSIIIAGDHQSVLVHAATIALNDLLGNVGTTVEYAPSTLLRAGTDAYDVAPFLEGLDTGEIQTAFVLGGNPAYTLPRDCDFARRLSQARARVYLSLHENETAPSATWFLHEAHFLESWGNERGYDGTISMRQPLIRPLYGGKSVEEVLAVLAGMPQLSGRALLRRHCEDAFDGQGASPDADVSFVDALRRGILEPGRPPRTRASADYSALADLVTDLDASTREGTIELDIIPDPRLEDGRLANNPWLLELPEPISKLVWDNAALVAPATARRLGLTRGDVVEIAKGDRAIRVPVLVSPGQAHDAIAIWFGWGRQGAESVARGVGTDVGPLRQREHPWTILDVAVRRTGDTYRLVTTQEEKSMHGRELVLHKTQQEWQREPLFAERLDETPPTLLSPRSGDHPQWGMAIDLNRCTGCSACVVACQAENNIPSVGKSMVGMGREMHWLRIDTYIEGPEHAPKRVSQPMLCQHCEKAPCEYVCPVNATVHSKDGLNEMVYNRCVGTRFCSNNCPYKVRRFNYYDWNQDPPEIKKLAYNPDVTVRARGVMEKCTYCVQRIRRTQIDAKLEHRPVRDGDVQTACEQVCPTNAIVFGMVSDADSRVSQEHRNLRTYGVLNDLGTQPRTRYLARIDNQNEEVPS